MKQMIPTAKVNPQSEGTFEAYDVGLFTFVAVCDFPLLKTRSIGCILNERKLVYLANTSVRRTRRLWDTLLITAPAPLLCCAIIRSSLQRTLQCV